MVQKMYMVVTPGQNLFFDNRETPDGLIERGLLSPFTSIVQLPVLSSVEDFVQVCMPNLGSTN